jgi:RHS repeat-associated protein
MNIHPITTPASPSPASPLTDASFDSIESLTTSFATSAEPHLETTTITEVALGYHRNQQYSITAMTTSTGAVAERYAYTAYGQPTILNASGSVLTSSAVGNRYTYTGREWDETLGLHHFRARWMSPLAGRFLGRDPIGYEGSPNGLYTFTSSNALRNTDPTGLYEVRPWTDPPTKPLMGKCKLRWRCWHIAFYKRHCGLVMEIDGNVITIDGIGGNENHIDWPPQPYLPDGPDTIGGLWQDVPIATCECLRQRSLEWNKNNVPRNSFYCNSNTTLRCLTEKCKIKIDFGVYGVPYRWGADCRKCLKWEWRRFYCGKKCVQDIGFCDQGFQNAAPDDPNLVDTDLPKGVK